MSHEPECPAPCCPWMPQPCDCQCDCNRLRAAYRRGYRQGRADGKATVHDCGEHSAACCSASYQRGYTAGYNDHARAAQHWRDTHGTYRQHGQGENP